MVGTDVMELTTGQLRVAVSTVLEMHDSLLGNGAPLEKKAAATVVCGKFGQWLGASILRNAINKEENRGIQSLMTGAYNASKKADDENRHIIITDDLPSNFNWTKYSDTKVEFIYAAKIFSKAYQLLYNPNSFVCRHDATTLQTKMEIVEKVFSEHTHPFIKSKLQALREISGHPLSKTFAKGQERKTTTQPKQTLKA